MQHTIKNTKTEQGDAIEKKVTAFLFQRNSKVNRPPAKVKLPDS
jgi:hypothetical protein